MRCHQRLVTGLVGVLVFLLLVHITIRNQYPHKVTIENVVHNKVVKGPPIPQRPLKPFPTTPIASHRSAGYQDTQHGPWLAAVICAAQDVQRRMLIRSTWMQLFQHVPFTPRFVVSNPGDAYTELVRFENQTFGDMIVLDTIQEDDITANTIKTLEFFKWLLNSGQKYEFVTKLDTDLWLNAPAFWDRYLKPRLSDLGSPDRPVATVNRTVIGELYFSDSGYATFAHGAIYTLTWDMVELLVSLQNKFDVFTGEDAAIGILLHKGEEQANFVNFRGDEKFNYDDADSRSHDSAFARPGTHAQARWHAIGSNAIAIHELKDTKSWAKVSQSFTETGVKPLPDDTAEPAARRLSLQTWVLDVLYSIGLGSPYTSMYDTIPPELIQLKNGSWICSDIWNLGPHPKGWQE